MFDNPSTKRPRNLEKYTTLSNYFDKRCEQKCRLEYFQGFKNSVNLNLGWPNLIDYTDNDARST